MTQRTLISQLIAARVKAGLRQADVARLIGVTRSTIARFEACERRKQGPTMLVLLRYADAVGVEITVGRHS